MPLVQACFEGNVVQLQELIGQREDVNAQVRVTEGSGAGLHSGSILPHQDAEKRTAVHAAAYCGEAECITNLVRAG